MFRAVNGRSNRFRGPVWVVMQAGALPAVFVVSGAAERWRSRRCATSILIGGSALWLGVKLAKLPVGRERPRHCLDDVEVRGPDQTGLGYPSGHAAIATMLAICATHPGPGRHLALTIAGATGLARMYVGAHLPLDVIGGAALGALAAGAVVVARPNGSCLVPGQEG